MVAISVANGIKKFVFFVGKTTKDRFATFPSAWGNCWRFPLHFRDGQRGVAVTYQYQVRFLPPYSPMHIPVENAFSVWKAELKNALSQPFAQENFRRVPQQGWSNWKKGEKSQMLLTFLLRNFSAPNALFNRIDEKWQFINVNFVKFSNCQTLTLQGIQQTYNQRGFVDTTKISCEIWI